MRRGERKRSYLKVFLLIALLLAVIIYLLWPFKYSLVVINEKNQGVVSNITILDAKGRAVLSEFNYKTQKWLWKGEYNVSIEAKGYEKEVLKISNKIGIKLNKNINQSVVLRPVFIALNKFRFLDPTGTLVQVPDFEVKGRNILLDEVKEELNYTSKIMYGFYSLVAKTENFERVLFFDGDEIREEREGVVILEPNENFLILEEGEVRHIYNFVKDYLKLSSEDVFPLEDRGFPRQFYLYEKDHVASLGDMLFLFCEGLSYQKSGRAPVFFIPRNKKYVISLGADDEIGCYERALRGIILDKIGNIEVSDFIFNWVFNTTRGTKFEIGRLNSKRRGAEISFTFDIESGRPVHSENKGESGISPCENDTYSLGLSAQVSEFCENADKIGWYTKLIDSKEEGEYPYPWVSGIKGYKDILGYSISYGIPITHFIVIKDYKAFRELAPEVINTLKQLIKDGLVEIGSHTLYHSRLESLELNEGLEELKSSREFLEGELNTTIVGFRAPYHSILNNKSYDDFTKALKQSGYKYWSNLESDFVSRGIESKPFNFAITYQDIQGLRSKVRGGDFVVTLAHPWDLYYEEVLEDGEVYLRENSEKAKIGRGSVLIAIANGAVAKKLRDL